MDYAQQQSPKKVDYLNIIIYILVVVIISLVSFIAYKIISAGSFNLNFINTQTNKSTSSSSKSLLYYGKVIDTTHGLVTVDPVTRDSSRRYSVTQTVNLDTTTNPIPARKDKPFMVSESFFKKGVQVGDLLNVYQVNDLINKIEVVNQQ